ncbi:tetratricopeptide repeat protein [bacterium]|nr:tetratricopeptide repeat protein [bacterium]
MKTANELFSACLTLFQQGRYPDCIRLAQQNSEITRTHTQSLLLVAHAYEKLDNNEEAINTYLFCLRVDRENSAACFKLGNLYFADNKARQAVHFFKKALAIQPGHSAILINLAFALSHLDRHQEANKYFRKALRLEPRNFRYHYYYANSLITSQQPYKAIDHLKKCLLLHPNYIDAYLLFIRIFIQQNKYKQAQRLLNTVFALAPDSVYAHVYQVEIPHTRDWDSIEKKLRQLADKETLPVKEKNALLFSLAKIQDKQQKYQEAYRFWIQGNLLRRQEHHYSFSKEHNIFKKLKKMLPREFLQEKKGKGYPSHIPIFIVGMPRSGTSLVEQILDSHAKVIGAGESKLISNITSSLHKRYRLRFPYPEGITQLSEETWREMGEVYVNRIKKIHCRADRITDKMPQNFLHLGFIQSILPRAKIIHCKRIPLDTCLSCFSIDFTDDRLLFTTQMNDIVSYYKYYQDLMRYWRNVLPYPIYEIVYEDLIEQPETIIAQLLEFCELPWDDNCLRFHQSKRAVHTASLMQVRQPIYKSSRGRWRNYAYYLAPYQAELGHTGYW